MIPLRLTGSRVLVALEPQDDSVEESIGMHYQDKGRSESGLIVLARPTDTYDVELQSRGLVVAVGEKKGQVDLDDVRAAFARDKEQQLAESREKQPDKVFDYIWTLDSVGALLDALAPAPFDVAVGDVILFPPSAGLSLGEHDDGIKYVLLNESDIWAVLEPLAKGHAA